MSTKGALRIVPDVVGEVHAGDDDTVVGEVEVEVENMGVEEVVVGEEVVLREVVVKKLPRGTLVLDRLLGVRWAFQRVLTRRCTFFWRPLLCCSFSFLG